MHMDFNAADENAAQGGVIQPAGAQAGSALRCRLIFNPQSGSPRRSPKQLYEILELLQEQGIQAEVFLVRPQARLAEVAAGAASSGFDLVIACGGDGTIDAVASGLVGRSTPLGIIPTGTQNNTARALGIPLGDLSQAVSVLTAGRLLRVDIGLARHENQERWFLEAVTAGLLSSLYPAADDIQHGNLTRIADLLSALVRSQPSQIQIAIDGGRLKLNTSAYMVLISNMPYIGAQFQPAAGISFNDSLLDLFVYARLEKLDLLGYAVQALEGIPEDRRILHYQVRQAIIESDPPMPILADGESLGAGRLEVSLRRQSLRVLAGETPDPWLLARSQREENGTEHA